MGFLSRWMPCEQCGQSVECGHEVEHVCDPEAVINYRMFHLRESIAALQSEVFAWLTSSEGRFHIWLAARDVKRSREQEPPQSADGLS